MYTKRNVIFAISTKVNLCRGTGSEIKSHMIPKAFQSKLMSLQGNLLDFALVLTRNREDAYDLVQDTMEKALTNYDKYEENTNMVGWLHTIMRNLFVNNYR